MCVLSIKVPIRKKSGNLLKAPRIQGIAGKERMASKVMFFPHAWASVAQSPKKLHQLSADTGCTLDDQLEAMDDRDGWKGRVREIHTDRMT